MKSNKEIEDKEWKKTNIKYCPRCGRKNTIEEWIFEYRCTECGEFGNFSTNSKNFFNEIDKYCRENRYELLKERDKEKIVTAYKYSIDRNLRNLMLMSGEKPVFLSEVLEVKCPKCGNKMKVEEYAYRGDVSCGSTLSIRCGKCHFNIGHFQEHVIINPDNEHLKVDVEEFHGHKSVYPFRWATSPVYG